jgi:integrase
LRHEAATRLYESGVDERTIMDIAGWNTPMLSTYRHKHSLLSAQRIMATQQPENAVRLNMAVCQ